MNNYSVLIFLGIRVFSCIYIIWDGRRKDVPLREIVLWAVPAALFVWVLPLYFLFSRKQQTGIAEAKTTISLSKERMGVFFPLGILVWDAFLLAHNGEMLGYGVLYVFLSVILSLIALIFALIGAFSKTDVKKGNFFSIAFVLSCIGLSLLWPILVFIVSSWLH